MLSIGYSKTHQQESKVIWGILPHVTNPYGTLDDYGPDKDLLEKVKRAVFYSQYNGSDLII